MQILVMGDLIRDIFSYYKSNRLSPECEVPVIIEESLIKQEYLGGAGNVASNLASMDTRDRVYFSTFGGEDMLDFLKFQNIYSGYEFAIKDRKTIAKNRIIINEKQICRIDNDSFSLSDEIISEYIESIKNIAENNPVNLIIYSDYNKYMFNHPKSSEIMNLFKGRIKIANPKPENIQLFKNMDLIVVNLKEASQIIQRKINNVADEEIASLRIKTITQSNNIIITKSENGFSLLDENDTFETFHGEKTNVIDVAGAGDVFTSMTGYYIARGKSVKNSAKIAHEIATISVSKPGICHVKHCLKSQTTK